MLISQVLNNNVILVEDGTDQEKVIWGRGIGFKRHAGQNYDVQSNDRVFSAVPHDDSKWIDEFKELSAKIPREYFELTERIIQIAQAEIDRDFDQHLLIPLTDHIFFAVERFKSGLYLSNPMLYDLKRFFAQEFAVGQQAKKMISELSGVKVTDDEAGFIAIHLVEHEISHSNNRVSNFQEFLEITDAVNTIIEEYFGTSFSSNTVAVNRLMTHLHFLILRAGTESDATKTSMKDSELLHMISTVNPRASACLDRVENYLEGKLHYRFTVADRLYLLIHIVHITE